MGNYLRDEQISNLTIDSEALSQLATIFQKQSILMPEYNVNRGAGETSFYRFFTIRFDQKGYRLFTSEELLDFFNKAIKVERIVFELYNSTKDIQSGSYVTLNLDSNKNTLCSLTVSSDNEEWMNCTFTAVKEVLEQYKNYHAVFRNPIVDFLIDILGLLIGFFISVWGATIISPKLTIDNSFLICFLLALILFSNILVLLKKKLKNIVFLSFPAIKFYRANKDRSHWLIQALVGGIVVAITIYALSKAFSYIAAILGVFVK